MKDYAPSRIVLGYTPSSAKVQPNAITCSNAASPTEAVPLPAYAVRQRTTEDVIIIMYYVHILRS